MKGKKRGGTDGRVRWSLKRRINKSHYYLMCVHSCLSESIFYLYIHDCSTERRFVVPLYLYGFFVVFPCIHPATLARKPDKASRHERIVCKYIEIYL